MSDLVSVIMPAYNAGPYVDEAVRSVLEQTYAPLELIAVNDGSTDDTPARLKRWGDRIRVIDQANTGVFKARNIAARAARGTFLAFIDADDAWRPGKLAAQIGTFAKFPEVGVAASWIEEIDADGRPTGREPKKPRGIMDRPADIYRHLLMVDNPVALSSAVIRKDLFDALGGFFDARRILSADYDLWIRAAEETRFYIDSEALCLYRILGTSLLHGSLEKEYGAQRGIIELNRARYTDALYRKRLSNLCYEWADSAFDQGDASAWPRWREAIALNPMNLKAWRLGLRRALNAGLSGRPGGI